MTFTVFRSGDLPREIIYFSTLSGTASYGNDDYQLQGGGRPFEVPFFIPAGRITFEVSLDILDDGWSDPGETFRAIIETNSGSGLKERARSNTVTIGERAQDTTYGLTVNDSTPDEGDTITFTVTRIGDRPEETVLFSTLSGTATFDDSDYALAGNGGRPEDIAINFDEGDATGTIQIRIADDGPGEGIERFGAVIEKDGVELDRISNTSIRIGESINTIEYNLSPGIEIVEEGNRPITFTVTRSGTNLQSETLYASTYSLTAASTSLGADKDGDGVIDDDYNGLIDVPVEFIGSAETATFTMRVNDDTHFEGDERRGLPCNS